MLAPRETLWATPPAVATRALELLQVCADDTLADYGCGDGVVLLQACKTRGCRGVGYEIHAPRALALQEAVASAGLADRLTVHASNALDAPLSDAPTKVFLYLIERGLALMLPLLREVARHAPDGHLPVVTALYRIPGVAHEERVVVAVSELVRTPLYRYVIVPTSGEA